MSANGSDIMQALAAVNVRANSEPIDATNQQSESSMSRSGNATRTTSRLLDEQWRAVVERDRSADGRFVYAVTSTGIFCRPTCPSRRPRRDRVRFFATTGDARRAGYRACTRCHPESNLFTARRSRIVSDACTALQNAERMPSLGTLARAAGLSPTHFHRLFRQAVGVTPREYRAAFMTEQAKSALRKGETVTGAMFDAKFTSSGRFYEIGTRRMGMTPSKVRSGGANETIRFATATCSLGHVLVAATTRGICEVWLGDSPSRLASRLRDAYPNAILAAREPAMKSFVRNVVAQVDSPAAAVDLPLDLRGTAFQMRVWRALMEIPVGTTLTYGEIAKTIGHPNSSRAVGQACARNHVAVIVPCHRAVGADNTLHGYRWGTKRKKALLEREQARG